jgi:hypothetical protein
VRVHIIGDSFSCIHFIGLLLAGSYLWIVYGLQLILLLPSQPLAADRPAVRIRHSPGIDLKRPSRPRLLEKIAKIGYLN